MVKAPRLGKSPFVLRLSFSSVNGDRTAETARGEVRVSSAPLPLRAPDAPRDAGAPLASRSKTFAPTEAALRAPPVPFSLTEDERDNRSISDWLVAAALLLQGKKTFYTFKKFLIK